jgi:glyoxylate utilization-related uncharacterized protein
MSKTLPTAAPATHGARLTSSATHGALLTVETVASAGYSAARVAHAAETLMRVVEGSLVLEVAREERVLALDAEARIPAGRPYRLASAGTGEARILVQLRATGLR